LALGPLIGDSIDKNPFSDVENLPIFDEAAVASSMADDAITTATRQNAKIIAANSAAANKARSAERIKGAMSSKMANDIVNPPNGTSSAKTPSSLSTDLANEIVSSVPQMQASNMDVDFDDTIASLSD